MAEGEKLSGNPRRLQHGRRIQLDAITCCRNQEYDESDDKV